MSEVLKNLGVGMGFIAVLLGVITGISCALFYYPKLVALVVLGGVLLAACYQFGASIRLIYKHEPPEGER
jgi:hypothetical protein